MKKKTAPQPWQAIAQRFCSIGFSLSYRADSEIYPEDYVLVRFPKAVETVGILEENSDYSREDISWEITQDPESGEMLLKVIFKKEVSEGTALTGTLAIKLLLRSDFAEKNLNIALQPNQAYKIILGEKAEAAGETDLQQEPENAGEAASQQEPENVEEPDSQQESENAGEPDSQQESENAGEADSQQEPGNAEEPASQQDTGDTEEWNLEDDLEDGSEEEIVWTSDSGNVGTMSFDGTLKYVDDGAWKDIIRPDSFDAKIRIDVKFQGEEEYTKAFFAQNSMSKNDFFLKFEYDENEKGAGSFQLFNMPVAFTDENTHELKQVAAFKISVDYEGSVPYYESAVVEVRVNGEKIGATTLDQKIVWSNVRLQTTVLPETSESFEIIGTYTNDRNARSKEVKYTVYTDGTVADEKGIPLSDGTDGRVKVPAGLTAEYVQTEKAGYKFLKSTLTEPAQTEGEAPEVKTAREVTEKLKTTAALSVEREVVFATENINQNYSHVFTVEWRDNNRADRPLVNEENFKLKYRAAGSEDWLLVDEDAKSVLGIENIPTLVTINDARGTRYAYKGLPTRTNEETPQEIEYMVQPEEGSLSEYLVETSETTGSGVQQAFVNTLTKDFSANIKWLDNDGDNEDIQRWAGDPEKTGEAYKEKLHLYRYIVGNDYEPYEAAELTLSETETADWTAAASRLPRYDSDNREYAYILVQGSISEADGEIIPTPIDGYKTYYDNGTGRHGNSTDRCYSGGTISNLITDTTTFEATKTWRDEVTSIRPDTSTVTLWRYSVNNKATDIDKIDEKFSVAAPVVYYPDSASGSENRKGIPLSYEIGKENETRIVFDKTTIPNLPENYQLPKYDEQGNLYEYFVREIPGRTSTEGRDGKADAYEAVYRNGDGTKEFLNGAPNNGIIQNIRKEKAEIKVIKEWKTPSHLEDVNGTSVQVKIQAQKMVSEGSEGAEETGETTPAAAEDQTWYDLPLLTDIPDDYTRLEGQEAVDAATITDFSQDVISQEIVFYVDMYSHDGDLYDMEHARIVEEVVNRVGEDPKNAESGTFVINGHTYGVSSEYEEEASREETAKGGKAAKQSFVYTVKNTIQGDKNYHVEKTWTGIEPDQENIQAVECTVYVYSENPEKAGTPVGRYEGVQVKKAEDGVHWLNPMTMEGSDGFSCTAAYKTVGSQDTRLPETEFTRLDAYDEDGYNLFYVARETAFIFNDNSRKTLEEANQSRTQKWGVIHYRYDDKTIINNHTGGDPVEWMYLEKIWKDGGDLSFRKPVEIRVYAKKVIKRAQTPEELQRILENPNNWVYQTQLNSQNQWYHEWGFRKATAEYHPTEMIALEYGLVESDQPKVIKVIDYKKDFEEIIARANEDDSSVSKGTVIPQVTGKVEIAAGNRQYRVTSESKYQNDDKTVKLNTFTNVRFGQVDIRIEKTWKDGGNEKGDRPDTLKFHLLRNGEPIPEKDPIFEDFTEIIEKEYSNGTYQGASVTIRAESQTDEESAETPEEADEDAQYKAANTWRYVVHDLPKFSSEGTLYTYSLVEMDSEVAKLAEKDYTSEKSKFSQHSIAQEGDVDHDELDYSFSNRKEKADGEVWIEMEWRDKAVNSANRPDAKMRLYRYVIKEGKIIPEIPTDVTDETNQKWEVSAENVTDHDWKITVSDLPVYDKNGYRYIYYFKEDLNNSGITVEGSYDKEEGEVTDVEVTPERPEKRPAVSAGEVIAFNHEKIINTITAEMSYTGNKTWTGMKWKYTDADLPSPIITLSRKVEGVTEKEPVASLKLIDNKHAFSFPDGINLSEDGELLDGVESPQTKAERLEELKERGLLTANGFLPKYDDQGRRYQYMVEEQMEGEIQNLLYSEELQSGTMINTFHAELNYRSIYVHKLWNRNRDSGITSKNDKYPVLKYTLYQYVQGTENPVKTVFDTRTVYHANGDSVVAFEELPIYSYTGQLYGYEVKEDSINGYAQPEYWNEDQDPTKWNPNGTETQESIENMPNNEAMQVTSNPGTPAADRVVRADVSLKNTYTNTDKIKLRGEKHWNDYQGSDVFGGRPDNIQVVLKRYTEEYKGYGNHAEEEIVNLREVDEEQEALADEPYIKWSQKGKNTDIWKYEIYNLDQYAPNGLPYIYLLQEQNSRRYKVQDAIGKKEQTVDGKDLLMNNLINEYDGSYAVRKNWFDGEDKYGMRPDSVTIYLWRKKENEDEWQKVPWEAGFGTYDNETRKWTGLPTVDNQFVSIELTDAYVVENTKKTAWRYVFTNIPSYFINDDGTSVKWEYKCTEEKIGPAFFGSEPGTENKSGAYERGPYKYTENQTTIGNTLDSTRLEVEKHWTGDDGETGTEDLYHSRPDRITFVLEKTESTEQAIQADAETVEWEPVTDKTGKIYTFDLTKEEGWKTTLGELPVLTVKEEEEEGSGTRMVNHYYLFFRAVELTEKNYLELVNASRVLNYTDQTKYSTNASGAEGSGWEWKDNVYNKMTNSNALEISRMKTITAGKIWQNENGDEPAADVTFELQYKKQGDESDTWHCYDSEKTDSNTHTDKCLTKTLTAAQQKNNEKATWTNLPAKDIKGNLLEYRIIEHPVAGYVTEESYEDVTLDDNKIQRDYTFTNIELQDYKVQKIWQNETYAASVDGNFTAEVKLQSQTQTEVDGTEWGAWTDVVDHKDQDGELDGTKTFVSNAANDTKDYTWDNLPKYTKDGKEIRYRAVETKINGQELNGANTDGNYIVVYEYKRNTTPPETETPSSEQNPSEPATSETPVSGTTVHQDPTFADDETIVTNRMIYGFVNLTKMGGFMDVSDGDLPEDAALQITSNGKELKNVTFEIYREKANGTKELYATVTTGSDDTTAGHLVQTDQGYGADGKKLIAGTYYLKEKKDDTSDYSVWDKEIKFVVGPNGNVSGESETLDTGDRGTAWITTTVSGATPALTVEYLMGEPGVTTQAQTKDGTAKAAYNLESRGTVSFEKKGSNGEVLIPHAVGEGEAKAYFGVYTDPDCTNQVAGMQAEITAESQMKLCDVDLDGTPLNLMKGEIPYTRKIGGVVYLLSGTYYVKELRAPSGYKLDTQSKLEITIPKISETRIEVENSGYADTGRIGVIGSTWEQKNENYFWNNEPNSVTIYKRDQYGKPVVLGDDHYLELKIESPTNAKFSTGESVIRLYQDSTEPCRDANGIVYAEGKKPAITYANGCWTITGLFEGDYQEPTEDGGSRGTIYVLSEPTDQVPQHYVQAADFRFQIKSDGSMVQTANGTAVQKTAEADTRKEIGEEETSSYYSSAETNTIVFRDVRRYQKNIVLKKISSENPNGLEHISFLLYQCMNGTTRNAESDRLVLKGNETTTLLTTDGEGKIDLSKVNTETLNDITGKPLKYGLPEGTYYFLEQEKGASDKYQLLKDPIYFTIASDNSQSTPGTTLTWRNTQDSNGKVNNDSAEKRVLKLKKVNADGTSEALSGARFTLFYTSRTDGDPGSLTSGTKRETKCYTGTDGILYEYNELLQETGNLPDISAKGTYELIETKAPDGYMTVTDAAGEPVTMLTFTVETTSDGEGTKVRAESIQTPNSSYIEGTVSITSANQTNQTPESLDITVKNKKTVAKINKMIDRMENTGELAGAQLQIFEGVYRQEAAGTPAVTIASTNDTGVETIPAGALKEYPTFYTLHEAAAPDGYLEAGDIYFYLKGTTDKDTDTAQIYVWSGIGQPISVEQGVWQKAGISKVGDTLIMVDETIVAPVNLKKVYEKTRGTKTPLAEVEFEVKDLDTNHVLGTAVTGADGYLTWKTNGITSEGYASRRIYNERREIVTGTANQTSVIILRQNTAGYQFLETKASDEVYVNNSFVVNIDDENYKSYKVLTDAEKQQMFVNIVAADKARDKKTENLSTKGREAADVAENPLFEATFQLLKYDEEHPDITEALNNFDKIGMDGVTFTLYRGTQEDSGKKVGDYRTGMIEKSGKTYHGFLEVPITKRGTYTLVETGTAQGYVLPTNPKVSITFTVVNEDYQKILTYDPAGAESSSHTKRLEMTGTGTDAKYRAAGSTETESQFAEEVLHKIANKRQHGTLILTKTDKDSHEVLKDVTYKLVKKSVNPKDTWYVGDNTPASGKTNEVQVLTGSTYEKTATLENGSQDTFAAAGSAGNRKETETAAGISAGDLVVKDLQWGEYELTEITEKDGYQLVSTPIPVTINAANLTVHKTAENEKNHLQVKKISLETENNELFGAKFGVYPVTESGEQKTMSQTPAEFYAAADRRSTDQKATEITVGTGDIYGLKAGTYVLKEMLAPQGYELGTDLLIKMERAGTFTAVSCSVDPTTGVITTPADQTMFSVSEENKQITVKNRPIEVEVGKYDQDEPETTRQQLSGTVFKITGTFAGDSAETTKEILQENFAADLKAKLVAGRTYTLEEFTAPAGYKVAPYKVEFRVSEDGKTITLINLVAEDGSKTGITDTNHDFLKVENNSDTGVVLFTLTDQKIAADVIKEKDAQGTALENQEKLGYAVFEVKSAAGKIFADGTTTLITDLSMEKENGETQTKFYKKLHGQLIGGDIYTLTETAAPKGYTIMDPITFTVDKKGKITFTGAAANGVTERDNGVQILHLKNEPTTLTFRKLAKDGTVLTGRGAEFELKGIFAEDTAENGQTDRTDTPMHFTDEQAAEMLKGKLIISPTGGTTYEYILKETKSPDGYEVSGAKELKFTIDGKGKWQFVTPVDETLNSIYSGADSKVLTTTDEPVSIKIQKTDLDGTTSLNGAKFKVESVSEDPETHAVLPFAKTTGQTAIEDVEIAADGTLSGLTGELIVGKQYKFTETTAPDGYELRPYGEYVAFTVEVRADGTYEVKESSKLKKDDGTEIAAATVPTDGNSDEITLRNNPIVIDLVKIGKDSAPLSGAKFELWDTCITSSHAHTGETRTSLITAGNDGTVRIPNTSIRYGHTYTLKETKAPDGYECVVEMTFTVKEDGTIELATQRADEDGQTITVVQKHGPVANRIEHNADNGKVTITVSNEKIDQSLVKVDADDPSIKLPGITFKLRPAEESAFGEHYNGEPAIQNGTISFTTDANGEIKFPEDLLVHGKSYILTEEKDRDVLPMYKLANDEKNRQITFKVEDDGKISITKGHNLYQVDPADPTNTRLIVKNDAIQLKVSKIDRYSGEKVAGAKLRLFRNEVGSWIPVNPKDASDTEWTTNATEDTVFTGENLIPGDYKLEETQAPDGYNVATEPLYFTIGYNGLITPGGGTALTRTPITVGDLAGGEKIVPKNSNYRIYNPKDGEAGDISIEVCDARFTNLQITKVDASSNTTKLKDVVFTLEAKVGEEYKYVKTGNTTTEVSEKTAVLRQQAADLSTDPIRPFCQVIDTTTDPAEATLTTGDNGIVTMNGLPDGTYRLKEIKTVAGYQLLSRPLTIVINQNDVSYWQSENTPSSKVEGAVENQTLSITVYNKKGFVLPATGVTVPKLPLPILFLAALLEGLAFLCCFQKRKKKSST